MFDPVALTSGRGGPVDVCTHDGAIYVGYQEDKGPNAHVCIDSLSFSGEIIHRRRISVGDDVGAFVRLASAHGYVWCLYREGSERGGRVVLTRDNVEVWRSSFEAGGNCPACFGWDEDSLVFAWQRAPDNRVFRHFVLVPSLGVELGTGAPDGLSHVDGRRVVLMKDVNGSVPGMTRPAWPLLSTVSPIVVGEDPNSGVIVRDTATGGQKIVFAGQAGAVPRVAVYCDIIVVATWGALRGINYGVRVTAIYREIETPVHVDPWPPGDGWIRRDDITSIDTVEYLCGTRDFARNGMHVPSDSVTYSHFFQNNIVFSPNNSGYAVHSKFGPEDRRSAVWTFTPDAVGLAYDATNELNNGYRFCAVGTTATAPIYPRIMTVGTRYTTPIDIVYLDGSPTRTTTFEGYVDGVYETKHDIGDVPAGLHAVIVFNPVPESTRGWRERNICRQGHGCWYWHRETKSPVSDVDMRWIGTTDVAMQSPGHVRFASSLPSQLAPPVTVTITDWTRRVKAGEPIVVQFRIDSADSIQSISGDLVGDGRPAVTIEASPQSASLSAVRSMEIPTYKAGTYSVHVAVATRNGRTDRTGATRYVAVE